MDAKDPRAIVGVADHCGWAILMTVAADGAVLDRRQVELVEAGLPTMPHHGEGQRLPPAEAVALVERVSRSVGACARACLDALAAGVPGGVAGIALRPPLPLPPTIAERITDYRAQTQADGVMYRETLAAAAAERGWTVHRYDAGRVLLEAEKAFGAKAFSARLEAAASRLGRPWRKDHRLAFAAAWLAARGAELSGSPATGTAAAPAPAARAARSASRGRG